MDEQGVIKKWFPNKMDRSVYFSIQGQVANLLNTKIYFL